MIELNTAPPFFAGREDQLQEILGRYPAEGRRSALMPLLRAIQDVERHVSEPRVHEVAEILGITATEVKGVMSFYSTYYEQPIGRYHLQVCSTLSCSLAGADQMYDYLAEELGIVNGETDSEGRFSIQKVECLGSCGTAPVLQVNDTYFERVGRARCAHLIAALKQGEMPEPWLERDGDHAGPTKATPVTAGAQATEPNGGE